MGQLAHWLMSVDLPLSSDLQCLLFQRLFESSLGRSSALHQLQDAMPILQKHSSSQSQDLNALGPAVILLQVLSKVTCFLRICGREEQIGLFQANGCSDFQEHTFFWASSVGYVKMMWSVTGLICAYF
jgi:hypothetical protein